MTTGETNLCTSCVDVAIDLLELPVFAVSFALPSTFRRVPPSSTYVALACPLSVLTLAGSVLSDSFDEPDEHIILHVLYIVYKSVRESQMSTCRLRDNR